MGTSAIKYNLTKLSEVRPEWNSASGYMPETPAAPRPSAPIYLSKTPTGLEILFGEVGYEDAPGGKGTVWKTYYEMVAIKNDVVAHAFLKDVGDASFKDATLQGFGLFQGEFDTAASNRLRVPTTSGTMGRPLIKAALLDSVFVPPKGFKLVRSNPNLVYRNFSNDLEVSKESLEAHPVEIEVSLNAKGEPKIIAWSTKWKTYVDQSLIRIDIAGYTQSVIGKVPTKLTFSESFGKMRRVEQFELVPGKFEMPLSFWKLVQGKQVRDYRLSGLARGEDSFFKKAIPPVAYTWNGKPLSVAGLKKSEQVEVASSPFVKEVVPGGSAQLTNLAIIVVSAVAVVGLFVWIAMGIMKRKAA